MIRLYARRKIYSAKMKDGKKVSVYIALVQQMASNLISMGLEIQDLDIAMTVLMGLPEKFENLNVAIDTLKENDITLDFVKSRLV